VSNDQIRCPACGTTNRIDPDKVAGGMQPVCGNCGLEIAPAAPPATDAHPIDVSDSTFASEVEGSSLPVLVDLWAPWCGPCRMLAPTLNAIASEMAGRARIVKLNVDENPVTADRLRVQGIPTMVLFKGGREVDRLVGAHPKGEILRRLEAALS
jgi:thioredoxin 2